MDYFLGINRELCLQDSGTCTFLSFQSSMKTHSEANKWISNNNM